jgi:hypothetical protein
VGDQERKSVINAFYANGKDASKLTDEQRFHFFQVTGSEISERANKLRKDVFGDHTKHK